MNLYSTSVKRPVSLGHPEVYVHADGPPDCLGREGIIKRTVLPTRKLYHSVLPYKSNSELTYPLFSACADTMNQGNCNTLMRRGVQYSLVTQYFLASVFFYLL